MANGLKARESFKDYLIRTGEGLSGKGSGPWIPRGGLIHPIRAGKYDYTQAYLDHGPGNYKSRLKTLKARGILK
jgi:hypothetical protein